MKTLILTLALFFGILVGSALAACSVHTVTTPDGRTMTCKTCCEEGSTCHTVCF